MEGGSGMAGADAKQSSRIYLVGLPIMAAGLAAAYLLALHPASGAGGGMLFLLIGWAAPSLLPLLLALWAALACRRGPALRLGVFALVLVLVGANTRLPELLSQLSAPKGSEWQVERRVKRLDRYNFVQVGSTDVLALAQPALPRVTWHGSERCMCLYLGRNTEAFYRGGLDSFFGQHALLDAEKGHGVHLAYEVTPDPDGRHGTVTLQFRDQQGVAATFRQPGIPLVPKLRDIGGEGLERTNVAVHGTDLLAHGNIGLALLSSWLPSYFDRRGFAAFMDAATERAQ